MCSISVVAISAEGTWCNYTIAIKLYFKFFTYNIDSKDHSIVSVIRNSVPFIFNPNYIISNIKLHIIKFVVE